jgi:hypothetical protein
MVSPTRKGLKIRIKIPLTIFEKAFWAAKPNMAAKTPAPANRAVPNVLKKGILEKIKHFTSIDVVDELIETDRGESGFGSSGK